MLNLPDRHSVSHIVLLSTCIFLYHNHKSTCIDIHVDVFKLFWGSKRIKWQLVCIDFVVFEQYKWLLVYIYVIFCPLARRTDLQVKIRSIHSQRISTQKTVTRPQCQPLQYMDGTRNWCQSRHSSAVFIQQLITGTIICCRESFSSSSSHAGNPNWSYVRALLISLVFFFPWWPYSQFSGYKL